MYSINEIKIVILQSILECQYAESGEVDQFFEI